MKENLLPWENAVVTGASYGIGRAMAIGFARKGCNLILIGRNKKGLEETAERVLEYNPNEYNSLLKPILENKAKVVYGSRLLGQHKDMYFMHRIGNKALSLITSILYGKKISDMETGYKVFKKEVIEGMKLNATRFDFEPEITVKILKKGYKIYEIPISFMNPRKFSEGKKITWKDGFMAVYYLIKYRFVN